MLFWREKILRVCSDVDLGICMKWDVLSSYVKKWNSEFCKSEFWFDEFSTAEFKKKTGRNPEYPESKTESEFCFRWGSQKLEPKIRIPNLDLGAKARPITKGDAHQQTQHCPPTNTQPNLPVYHITWSHHAFQHQSLGTYSPTAYMKQQPVCHLGGLCPGWQRQEHCWQHHNTSQQPKKRHHSQSFLLTSSHLM